MDEQTPQTSSPSSGTRQRSTFTSCFAVILRTAIAIVLGIMLGLVIFYGIPNLYRRYVLPIENSITRLEDGQDRQAAENQRIARRMDDFQNRLNELELQNDANKQALDDIKVFIIEIGDTQSSLTQDFESLQADSQDRTAEVVDTVASLRDLLEGLDEKLMDLESSIADTDREVLELASSLDDKDTPVAALRRELRLVIAMELITRSRLFLTENNLGLAENDIRSARNLLSEMQELVPEHQLDALSAIIVNLDASLENLPDRPVLASETLELAWQQLLNGLPGEVPLSSTEEITSATPTPTTTP